MAFTRVLAFTGLLGALAGNLPAETKMVTTNALRITSIQQFWDVPVNLKSEPQEVALDCTVTFFDPFWKVLFVQDDEGDGAYVPYGNNPYPFKAGERITARGQFLPPNADISFEHVVVVHRAGPPPAPLPATQEIDRHGRFKNRYVSLDGFVDRERRNDGEHLQLVLSVNGGSVVCWIMMEPSAATPDLADRKVHLEGVYNPKIGPDGLLASLEIMVPDLSKVTALGRLDEDPAFALPATPINLLPRLPNDQLVRVVGAVVSREAGRYVRIRDGGGQVDLITGQMRPLAINDMVEAIGYPSLNGPVWRLENALFRAHPKPAGTDAPPGQVPGTIGLAAEVLKLSTEEASQGRPVWLTGVVTWSHRTAPFFFIHDSSGGICVMRDKCNSPLRAIGRNVEVHGVTAMGPYAPVVVASSFDRVSEAILPLARAISLEHALTGVEEAQWVELRGLLRRISSDQNWHYLEIATATSDFTAVLPLTEDVSSMVGSVIRLQGVCTAETDGQRKLTGIRLWVPGVNYVQVEEPAPEDPFSLPTRSLASLGQFETVQAFNRRLHVAGTVLQQSPGHAIHLLEDGHSLLVYSRDRGLLQPGDRIEAVGFLGRQAGRIVLREAVFRVTGAGRDPLPKPLEPTDDTDTAQDGQLVALTGTLLGQSIAGNVTEINVQSPHKIFEATCEGPPARLGQIEPGSRVTLTGVYDVVYDEQGRPGTFTLRLRTPADIVVVESPSWWTRGRILAFTGVIAVGAVLFLVWVTVLRRQVQQQTDLIRAQVQRETRLQAELTRAGKLESLGLLAGGIAHDFNNLLTVLMGNISLIRLDGALTPDAENSLAQAEKAALRARDLTQQLLTFAKGGAPLRAAVSLPEVVKEVAEFALRGSKVRCTFNLPSDLWPASVDKGQIGQVVQNIVINALQAMPDGGAIEISLSNRQVGPELGAVLAAGRYVRLDIRDHGPGIAAADLSRIFDPYFTTKKQGSGLGLATVHSIVKKHAGHVTAESEPGQGTTFHVWLPAADTAAEPFLAETTFSSPPLRRPTEHARILFMDDEEFIRELGCSILRRYGYRVSTVNDGFAALSEYSRARDKGEPFDVVILDLTIPGGMGGRQTMEELLKLDPTVKAIVSSGYSNDLVLSNYQAHGFRGMVSKPYDVTDFAHAVERVLRGERA